MSVIQSSTTSPSNITNTLASESEYPSLPGVVPAVIEDINNLQAQMLKARTVESAHKIGQELRERLREVTELFTKLYDSASEVSRLSSSYFNKENDVKGPWDSKRTEKQARKKAMQALQELDQVIKKDVSQRVVHPEVTVTPNYLPSIQGVSGSLGELSDSLQKLMTEALNPSKDADIENVKFQLTEHRERFQELGKQAKALEKPVAEKASALDLFIEQTREHTGEIAIHNALCSWEITRINLFTNVMSKLMDLQQLIAGLKNNYADLKIYLRGNAYTTVDLVKLSVSKILEAPGERTLKAVEKELRVLIDQYPDTAASGPKETLVSLLNGKPETKISEATKEIQAVRNKFPESPVDNASREFKKIERIYNEGKSKAEEYRSDAEKAIKDLRKLIENAEKDLVATVDKVPFHDAEIQEKIIKQMEEAISSMQGQRKTMLFKLEETWKMITEQFSSDSRDHLFLEVNRLGYAIFEYEGVLPLVITFRLTGLADLYVKPLTSKEGVEVSSSTGTKE